MGNSAVVPFRVKRHHYRKFGRVFSCAFWKKNLVMDFAAVFFDLENRHDQRDLI